MDSKKLAKVIKAIVSAEVKRQLPILVQEEVNKKMKKILTEVKRVKQEEPVEQETDMFSLANQMLEESRSETSRLSMLDDDEDDDTPLSKNPIIDKILKQTKPFSPAQRTTGPVGFEERFKQPINEASGDGGYEEWPTMEHNLAPTPGKQRVPEDIRSQMAAKMGYGDMAGGPQKTGLGVTTGIPSLDRVLNRDNSELIKAWNKKK